MIPLIYDRTAADVLDRGIVPEGVREDSDSSVTLWPDNSFAAKAGKTYMIMCFGPKRPGGITVSGTYDESGEYFFEGYYDHENKVDAWDYVPAADAHVTFLFDDFATGTTAEEIAALVIVMENGRGHYRHTDLNRVQAAIAALRARFGAAGYTLPAIAALSAWAENDVPMRQRMDEYLRAVSAFAAAFPPVQPGTDFPVSMDGLDWRGANAIEEFLHRIDVAEEAAESAWFYSGEVFAGEVDE